MKGQDKINLTPGDSIGFVQLAQDMDSNDSILFVTVTEVVTQAGERAYRYAFPDGSLSRSVVRQSELGSHLVKIQVRDIEPLCLNDRLEEFYEATKRAEAGDLEVFPDWERDSFVVVNHAAGTEYRVTLRLENGKMRGTCECADFKYRRRICKHQAEILIFAGDPADREPVTRDEAQACGCRFNRDDRFRTLCDAHFAERAAYETAR